MHEVNLQNRAWIATAICAVVLVWYLNGLYLATLAERSALLFWLADIGQWILLPGALLLLLATRCGIRPTDYGFDAAPMGDGTTVFWATAAFITIAAAFFLPRNIAWSALGYPSGSFSLPDVYPTGIAGTLVWLYSALTAGFVESIFFIGLPWLVYRSAAAKPLPLAFTAVASLIFAFAHWEQGPHTVIGAFFSHAVACLWFFSLGHMWPTAIGHTLVDLVAFG